jgi:hypothetical protein
MRCLFAGGGSNVAKTKLVTGLPAPDLGSKLVNDVDGTCSQSSVAKTKAYGFDGTTVSVKANFQVFSVYTDRTDV